MTLHAAIEYFDDRGHPAGYLVGADRRAVTTVTAASGRERRVSFLTDKTFATERVVGLLTGTIRVPSPVTGCGFRKVIDDLTTHFDDVESGVSFADLSSLTSLPLYCLLLGKRLEDAVELYTVSNVCRRQPHVARRLHRIDCSRKSRRDESTVVYTAGEAAYAVCATTHRYGLSDAREALEKILTLPSAEARSILSIPKTAQLGTPVVYSIMPARIERL